MTRLLGNIYILVCTGNEFATSRYLYPVVHTAGLALQQTTLTVVPCPHAMPPTALTGCMLRLSALTEIIFPSCAIIL